MKEPYQEILSLLAKLSPDEKADLWERLRDELLKLQGPAGEVTVRQFKVRPAGGGR